MSKRIVKTAKGGTLIPWEKGQSGNPNGRPKTPPELKAMAKLTKKELAELGSLIIKNDIATLKALSKDKNQPMMRSMIISIAIKIYEKGDMYSLDVLLNRLIGKVKEEIEHSGDVNMPQVVVSLPSNGREVK